MHGTNKFGTSNLYGVSHGLNVDNKIEKLAKKVKKGFVIDYLGRIRIPLGTPYGGAAKLRHPT